MQSNASEIRKYLIFTFLSAWIMQVISVYFYRQGNLMAYQLIIMASMFTPVLGVLFSKHTLAGIRWKPVFRGHVKQILFAWLMPFVLTALGALLYFLVFPEQFDASGQILMESLGEEAASAVEAQNLSPFTFLAITLASSIFYAPFVNAIPAVGEEAGWRGMLYPYLKEKYGREKGWILGGIIWSAWHWPLIALAGYEYGTAYFGFPVTGMLVFSLFTTSIGILCGWLYETGTTIWMPALLHGSINAAATFPTVLAKGYPGSMALLGPVPNGLLSGLPLLVCAVLIAMRMRKADAQKP